MIPYYYSNNKAIGSLGDFITAPEISQMFGETIAFFFLNQYQNLKLDEISLLELGPGKGTLMHDIMRVKTNFKEFNIESSYMLEISDTLASIQKERLSKFQQIYWIDNIEKIKAKNLFVIGNEFFDALPIRQLEQAEDGCYETSIVHDAEKQLCLGKVKISNDQVFNQHGIFETSPDCSQIIKQIAEIKTNSTLCIFIDYGYTSLPLTSTLQALNQHAYINILDQIGESDITSLVNFSSLANQFSQYGFECEVMTQADFLKMNGIETRAAQLLTHGANKEEIESALKRLISSQQMGELFKVLIAYKETQ